MKNLLNQKTFIIVLIALFLGYAMYQNNSPVFQAFFDLFKSEVQTTNLEQPMLAPAPTQA